MDTQDSKDTDTESHNGTLIDAGRTCSPRLTDATVGKRRSAYDIESLIGRRHSDDEKTPDTEPASPSDRREVSSVGSYGEKFLTDIAQQKL